MAKEWYLMSSDHDTVSGFEGEAFESFNADAFREALASPIASDVEVCNYDLTERRKLRAIIQGTTQDTKLKSTNRSILAPIGTCKAGQYVYHRGRYWMIVGLVDNNGFYEKGVMTLCNYCLTWLNDEGKPIQRWANITSASQYNHGETSTRNYWIRSDQLLVLIPDDEETLMIKHKSRFIIDRRCAIYEKRMSRDVTFDSTRPLLTYELTRTDNVLYDYQDSGHFEFMAYQDEQHDTDGYYVIDDKGYWLCDIPVTGVNKSNFLTCEIDCEIPDIYCGIEPTVFCANFYDSEGNIVDVEPQWEIQSDFEEKMDIEYADNSISIYVDDDVLINKSFKLAVTAEGYESVSRVITIKAFI